MPLLCIATQNFMKQFADIVDLLEERWTATMRDAALLSVRSTAWIVRTLTRPGRTNVRNMRKSLILSSLPACRTTHCDPTPSLATPRPARVQQLRLGVLAAVPALLIVGNLVPLWFLFLMGGWAAMASGNPIVRGYITLARFELQSRRYAASERAIRAT